MNDRAESQLRISMTSGEHKFHVDGKKGLARRFPATFPLPLFSPKGAWQIDTLAEHALWRVTVPDQAITFSRLAVHRAWQAARTIIGQKRGEFEARSVLQKGYLDEQENPIRELQIAADHPEFPLSLSATEAWLCAKLLAGRLDLLPPPEIAGDGTCLNLAAWLKTLETQVSATGRTRTFDLNAFFQSLVGFWDRNMNFRAPSSWRRDAETRRHRISFHDFAAAAARDAGCTNASPQRAISRAVIAVRRHEKLI